MILGVTRRMVNSETPRKRVAFVLIDGLGDVSIPRFGYKTPLEAAKVPNLDAIASAGVNGLMDPVEVGLGCGSDTAHLSLLGYDPRVYYRGRGAFESMGAGLAMAPGDIAFKVCKPYFLPYCECTNFCSVFVSR
uniref:Putative 2,3-bisphosphoglycerate-independent phosphoglycerate mutase n=1 Tax=Helianthus annuus TaxID=4232 RepID=A0A251RSR9_HELAN